MFRLQDYPSVLPHVLPEKDKIKDTWPRTFPSFGITRRHFAARVPETLEAAPYFGRVHAIPTVAVVDGM